MDDQRISRAMQRIDEALGRIDSAARNRPQPGGNAQLVARHEALRDQVSASLAELDTLIGRLEK